MRITRLHILLGLIGLGLVGYGIFSWMQRRAQPVPGMTSPPSPIVNKQVPRIPSIAPSTRPAVSPLVSATPAKRESVARTIATIGEAYKALPRLSGEIPSIAQPLHLAKDYLASDHLDLAMVCARQAWTALKKFQPTKETLGESYEVVKGDTLWRIARDRSPVHQGPGWVTIWKANKRVVKDFNRIEVGWNLAIPDKPSQYVEPYWRPRHLTSARNSQPASLVVDLPEVLAWAGQQKKKSAAGTSLYAYLAAQETGNSLPLLGRGWPKAGRGIPVAFHRTTRPSPQPSPFSGEGERLAYASGALSLRQAAFSVSARPFLESPQYQ